MPLFTRTSGGYFVAHNATLTGELSIAADASFWFNVVVRGDVAQITIGRRVNVQDGSIIHCDTGIPSIIEDDVSIGHGAIVHGKFIGRGTLIGMGAIVLSESTIGQECLIAAGAVVSPKVTIPDRSVVMGVPGRVVRQVNQKDLDYFKIIRDRYVELADKYVRGEL
ncbi:MAG: gamma carbonic anhydrase family protein [Anaerolineae bacterium]|nr:gamma carbonic anhydrase family protein [Phycisphaerae bacterium]